MNEFIDKLISRLEKHVAYNEKMLKMFPNMGDVENAIYRTQKDIYESSIRIVNELAEEYKGGWIPCSEKLPTETRLYWTTMQDKEVQVRYVRKIRYYSAFNKWIWDNGRDLSEHTEVIAWQEYVIPAPYGAEDIKDA